MKNFLIFLETRKGFGFADSLKHLKRIAADNGLYYKKELTEYGWYVYSLYDKKGHIISYIYQ